MIVARLLIDFDFGFFDNFHLCHSRVMVISLKIGHIDNTILKFWHNVRIAICRLPFDFKYFYAPPLGGEGIQFYPCLLVRKIFCQRFLDLCMLDWFDIWSKALSGLVVLCLSFSGPWYVYFLFARTLIEIPPCKIFVKDFSSHVGLIWYLVWSIIRVSCTTSPLFRSIIWQLPVCRDID